MKKRLAILIACTVVFSVLPSQSVLAEEIELQEMSGEAGELADEDTIIEEGVISEDSIMDMAEETAKDDPLTGVEDKTAEERDTKAGDAVDDGTFKGTINKDGKTVTITGLVEDEDGDYPIVSPATIPSKIGGMKVTAIGSSAFQISSDNLGGELTLPKDLKTIGDFAFSGCKDLSGKLSIPKGVTNIGEFAFYDCKGLKGTLTIPKSLKNCGMYPFDNCIKINKVINKSDCIVDLPEIDGKKWINEKDKRVISEIKKGTAVLKKKSQVHDIRLITDKLVVQKGKTNKNVEVITLNDSIKSAKSDKKNIADVKVKGKKLNITGKGVGKATITVTSKNGKKEKLKVTVQKEKVTTKSIKLSETSIEINVDDVGQLILVTASPDYYSTGEKIKVTSSDKKIAQGVDIHSDRGYFYVDPGKKTGKCKLTVKVGKKSKTINVKVNPSLWEDI